MYDAYSGFVSVVRYGLVARIPGFHPGGSGSIPGTGMQIFCEFKIIYKIAIKWH